MVSIDALWLGNTSFGFYIQWWHGIWRIGVNCWPFFVIHLTPGGGVLFQ